MTTITALPTPPNRSMAATAFVVAADTFLAALPAFVSQINVLANEVASNADLATNSADQAIAAAGAAAWVSGQYYNLNVAAISQVDFQTYRRKIAGAGTYDPKYDQTNWTLLNPLPASLTTFMHTTFGGF
jgi:hypothetical protein